MTAKPKGRAVQLAIDSKRIAEIGKRIAALDVAGAITQKPEETR